MPAAPWWNYWTGTGLRVIKILKSHNRMTQTISREAARLEEERKRQQRLQQAEVLKQELQAMRETYREGLKMLSTLEAMLVDDKSLTGLSRQMAYQQFKKRLERTGIKAQRALEEKIRRMEG